MDQISGDSGLSNDGGHDFSVSLGFRKDNECRRRKNLIQIMEMARGGGENTRG